MPNFDIVAPNGSKFRLVAPEGATQEQILEKAQAAKLELSKTISPANDPEVRALETYKAMTPREQAATQAQARPEPSLYQGQPPTKLPPVSNIRPEPVAQAATEGAAVAAMGPAGLAAAPLAAAEWGAGAKLQQYAEQAFPGNDWGSWLARNLGGLAAFAAPGAAYEAFAQRGAKGAAEAVAEKAAGEAPPPKAPPAATAAEAAAAKPVSGLTPEEIARLKKSGYPPELIAKIEAQAAATPKSPLDVLDPEARAIAEKYGKGKPAEKAKLRYDPKTDKLVPKEAAPSATATAKKAPEPPASIKRMKNDKMAQNAYRMWLGSKEQVAKHGMSKEEVEQAVLAYRGEKAGEAPKAGGYTPSGSVGGGIGGPIPLPPTKPPVSDRLGAAPWQQEVASRRRPAGTVVGEKELAGEAKKITGRGELPKYAGSINLPRYNTLGRQQAIAAAAERLPATKPVTLGEVEMAGRGLGLGQAELKRADLAGRINEVIPYLHAGRELLNQASDHVWRMARTFRRSLGTPEYDAASYNFAWALADHMTIQEDVARAVSATGRALGSLRAEVAKKVGPLAERGVRGGVDVGKANRISMLIDEAHANGVTPELSERLIKELGGKPRVEAKADMMANADNPEQLNEMARNELKPTSLGDKIFWAYLNARFSPQSWGRKLLGDSVMDALHILDTGAASVIGKFHGGDKVYAREAAVEAGAMFNGIKAMLHDFKSSPMGSAFLRTLKGSGEAYSKAYPEVQAPKGLEGTWAGELFTAGPTVRPLQAINSALATNGYIMETERLAAREAIRAGKGGSYEELRQAIDGRLQLMKDRLAAGEADELHEAGVKAAKYLTNTRSLGGLARRANDFLGYKGLRYLFPVRHIPLNLVKTFVEHTPIALALPDVWKEIYSSRAAFDMVMGRIAVGTGIMSLAAWLAYNDKITGDGPVEAHKRATWALTHKPRSMNIGGQWYPLSAFEPATNFFVTAADYVEAGRMIDAKNTTRAEQLEQVFQRTAASFIRDLASDTYFTTVKQVFEAISDPSGRPAQQLVARLASNVVPAVVSQAARALDPWERETRGILDQLKAAIPYERQTLPIRPDVLGRPVPNQPTVGTSLVTGATPVDKNPVAKELQALGLGLMYVRPQPIKLANGRTAEYDKPALERYRQLYMQETQQAIQRVISLPSYNDWPTKTKQKLVRNARNAALRAVRAKMQPDIQRLTQGIKAEAPQE